MELVQYLRGFRKWIWLILVATVVGGGASLIIHTQQPSIYQAETTIAIGRYIETPNPNSAEIRTGMDLAQTYAQLVTTFNILQATIDNLNLPLASDALKRQIDVHIVTGTSLLVITVQYSDPVLTADIANSLAEQLIANSPTNLTEEQTRQLVLLDRQIQVLNIQIEENRERLELVNTELAEAANAIRANELTEHRNRLVDQINDSAATIASFSTTVANLQDRINALSIVERARVPANPAGPSVAYATLLGALVGAMLAVGLVMVLEYLDDHIRTSEAVVQILNLPVLGAITQFGGRSKSQASKRLNTHPNMANATAESYRMVCTNLLFLQSDYGKSVFIVTSPDPFEGKSTTTSNLGISLAQSGKRVVLIDADTRRPSLHEIFELPNGTGLLHGNSTVVRSLTNSDGQPNEQDIIDPLQCLQLTHIPNLYIMTSGLIPVTPAETLDSGMMQGFIEAFRASPHIDIILIDTPPALRMADASLLAGLVKADVILVLDATKTRITAAQKARWQFEAVGARIVGVVLNRVNPRDEGHGSGYYPT